jgi:hypothetical protein
LTFHQHRRGRLPQNKLQLRAPQVAFATIVE